ncbi:MAG: tetratricopeptide repeat protein, partial [Rickettsiaceae bacterium]|nr:tetratricopeptide repeat protein [Rickettsiaceae bacterium]
MFRNLFSGWFIEIEEALDALNAGSEFCNRGDYQRAIKAYDEAIGLKQDYADAYYNKGLALSKLSRHEDAIAAFNEAIRLKPEDNEFCASAYVNKGTALDVLSRYEEAVLAYDEAIRLKPED